MIVTKVARMILITLLDRSPDPLSRRSRKASDIAASAQEHRKTNSV